MLPGVVFMPSFRLAAALLLLTSCAAWEVPAPGATPPPPAESPVPSHYAPPPPVGPSNDVPPAPVDPSNYIPPAPVDPTAMPTMPVDRVAIAAVQLLENCPDAPEPAVDAKEKAVDGASKSERETADRSQTPGYVPRCEQSTVQLSLRSDRSGRFRIEAVRVLDGAKQRLAGSSTLRQPTSWGDGQYRRWDERVVAGKELQISYKLGALDLSRGAAFDGPDFNTMSGPFILELEVSIEGVRQTIRSPVFEWQRMDMVET